MWFDGIGGLPGLGTVGVEGCVVGRSVDKRWGSLGCHGVG